MVQPILQIARDGSCLARARDAPCDCLGSCLFIHLVFHLSYIECISQSRLALKQNKKSENDRRQCLMFTANREPRSFSLWLGIFTRYKKKSAGSVHPKQAGQGCWHKLQTQTTCAQGTKIIYRWSIAYLSFSVNGLPLWVGNVFRLSYLFSREYFSLFYKHKSRKKSFLQLFLSYNRLLSVQCLVI